jgi:hypothetical protein
MMVGRNTSGGREARPDHADHDATGEGVVISDVLEYAHESLYP